MRMVIGAVIAAVAFTACGSDADSTESEEPVTQESSESTPAAEETEIAEVPRTAEAVSAAMREAIGTVTDLAETTEDNDPNELIGRPGQYVSAWTLHDERAECEESDTDLACGAKIEEFESEEDAQTRADYLEEVTSGVPAFAEYDYLDGTLLLRVTGSLKPSEAKEYEAAFLN